MCPQEQIDKVIEQTTRRDDGRRVLACARAFALARELEVPVSRIGQMCNEHNIKIASCQLGCF